MAALNNLHRSSPGRQARLGPDHVRMRDRRNQARAVHGACTPASAEAALPDDVGADVESSSLPRHIAVIMDGNARWAKSRGLPVRPIHCLLLHWSDRCRVLLVSSAGENGRQEDRRFSLTRSRRASRLFSRACAKLSSISRFNLGLQAFVGHERGVESLRTAVRCCQCAPLVRSLPMDSAAMPCSSGHEVATRL